MNHTFLEGNGQLGRVMAFMTELEREPPPSSSHQNVGEKEGGKTATEQQPMLQKSRF